MRWELSAICLALSAAKPCRRLVALAPKPGIGDIITQPGPVKGSSRPDALLFLQRKNKQVRSAYAIQGLESRSAAAEFAFQRLPSTR
jgi:hypothetical protein